ncbi:hypothetical protein BC332_30499 [Capsicum chinense]|nr:hypothetical protein BC332_30499 [Capsicum chinense]
MNIDGRYREPVPVSKNLASSSVTSVVHVRALRKGFADQLAINIDPESKRLINDEEADEEKGHAFKSLNISGLIPGQGKMIADRIDGICLGITFAFSNIDTIDSGKAC